MEEKNYFKVLARDSKSGIGKMECRIVLKV